jgi:hypothetical protein
VDRPGMIANKGFYIERGHVVLLTLVDAVDPEM